MSSLNPKVIAELRALEAGGPPGQVRDLIDLFLREGEGQVRQLRSGVEGRDRASLDRSARILKRSSGNLGAMALARLCSDLQEAVRSGRWERARDLLPGLDAEFRTVRTELEAERSRLPPNP